MLVGEYYGDSIKFLYCQCEMSPTDIANKYGFRRESVKNFLGYRKLLRTQSEASKLAVKQGKKDKAIGLMIKASKTTNRFNPTKIN